LIGVIGTGDSFQADFMAPGNGFVGTGAIGYRRRPNSILMTAQLFVAAVTPFVEKP
jgi:hypothetical protein